MEKLPPKRSLLDDQPFLSSLEALDRELAARADGDPPASPASAVPRDDTPAPPPASTLTYEPFFGLAEKAFSLASDPRFFYRSEAHRAVSDELLTAIRRREGIVVLTGDIGTGKTTLCRTIIGDLDRQTFTARIDDPFLSFEELVRQLLVDFGVVSAEEVTSGRLARRGRHELTLALQEFLRSLALLQAFAVVIVDEAQNVSLDLLEHVRILTDIGGSGQLLQVVLVGQPDLLERLATPEMRAFNQRIARRSSLGPLAADEIAAYVEHRLSVAGGSMLFRPDAVKVLARASHGVPRVLNLVCDRALALAAEEGSDTVDAKIAARAAEAQGFLATRTAAGPSWWRRKAVAIPAAALVVAAAAGAGVVWWEPPPVRGALQRWAGQPAFPPARPLPTGPPLAAVPVPAAPPAPRASASGDFAIQVGTFREADRANDLVAALQQLAFRAYVVPVDLGGRGQWQAVLVGRYADQASADAELRRLQASGAYDGARVLRVGGGS